MLYSCKFNFIGHLVMYMYNLCTKPSTYYAAVGRGNSNGWGAGLPPPPLIFRRKSYISDYLYLFCPFSDQFTPFFRTYNTRSLWLSRPGPGVAVGTTVARARCCYCCCCCCCCRCCCCYCCCC